MYSQITVIGVGQILEATAHADNQLMPDDQDTTDISKYRGPPILTLVTGTSSSLWIQNCRHNLSCSSLSSNTVICIIISIINCLQHVSVYIFFKYFWRMLYCYCFNEKRPLYNSLCVSQTLFHITIVHSVCIYFCWTKA